MRGKNNKIYSVTMRAFWKESEESEVEEIPNYNGYYVRARDAVEAIELVSAGTPARIKEYAEIDGEGDGVLVDIIVDEIEVIVERIDVNGGVVKNTLREAKKEL